MEIKGIKSKTTYRKVAEIDGLVIFADERGYFVFEHYPPHYALPVILGKTKNEVKESIADYNNWNYRQWHGEMAKILDIKDEFDTLDLPDIK